MTLFRGTFLDTPQVPFEDFLVNFNSGPRASISTPQACGNYTTEASFTSWSGATVSSSTGGPRISRSPGTGQS